MRFWLATAGVIILGGFVAMIVFLIIGAALLEWGFIGALLLVGALMLGVAWVMDKRRERGYREYEKDLTDQA